MAALTHLAVIAADGTVRMIYSDDYAPALAAVGRVEVARASHVEPTPGGWTADMTPVNGPVLGPFARRDVALAAEVAWLAEHSIPTPNMEVI